MTATSLFNTVPTTTEAPVVPWNWLFSSLITGVCVLQLQPPYHGCLHVIITLKFVAAKAIL